MKKTNIQKEYIMSPEELKELQSIQKELISEVKRICSKYNIHFNMVGGTMLGAVRHQGYIPWDDDADIGFLRNEYEKFREVCKTELNTDKYYIQDIRDMEGYRWGYGKLRRKNTEFIRLNQEHMPYEQGIFIDLMPFDNVPDNIIHRRIHLFQCFLLRKILWSEVGKKAENNPLKKLLYIILSLIPKKIIVFLYQNLVNKIQKKTKLVRILTFPTSKGIYGYKREWYTRLKNYKFDELSLPGAVDYDGYLSTKYGKYMQLPPIEKRKIHPISKIQLLRSGN